MARRANPIVALHIPDDYKLNGREDRINHSVVRAKCEPGQRARPECGCVGHAHGKSTHKVYHLPVKGVPLVILHEVVRFKCPECKRTRFDDYSDLAGGLSPHITSDSGLQITPGIIDKTGIAAVSRKEGPNEELFTKAPGAAVLRCSYLPRTLCIDRLSAHTGKGRLDVAISDGDSGCLARVLERPLCDRLGGSSQFSAKERARVEYLSCDIPETFIAAKELWFPGAKLRVDRSRVVKEVLAALYEARLRATDSKEPDGGGNPAEKDRFTAKVKKELKRASR